MYLKKAVGKIVKLEIFKLESSFQFLLHTWEIVKFESFFQLKACQCHDIFKYPFQLHVSSELDISS